MVSVAIALIMTERFGLRIEGWVVATMLMSLSVSFLMCLRRNEKLARLFWG